MKHNTIMVDNKIVVSDCISIFFKKRKKKSGNEGKTFEKNYLNYVISDTNPSSFFFLPLFNLRNLRESIVCTSKTCARARQ